MSERAIVFDGGRLVGILSEPQRRDPARPCVVLLNAGLVPRTGPGRLTVLLSRALADAGFAVFRVDLSGLGDSEPRVPPLPAAESNVADARAALDALAGEDGGHGSFVIGGLCSGAVGACYAACADERVVGVVALDGFCFPTGRWRLLRLVDRFRNPRGLVRSVLRRLPLAAKEKPAVVDPDDAFLPRWPARERAAAELAGLVRRQVRLLCVFTGEWEQYRYEGQLRDGLPSVAFGELLTERRIPLAEHLYFTAPERRELIELIRGWLVTRFPSTNCR